MIVGGSCSILKLLSVIGGFEVEVW